MYLLVWICAFSNTISVKPFPPVSLVPEASFGTDYVLVKLSPVPMPPLFMAKILHFVVGLDEIFIDLHRNGHSLSIVIDGNCHRPFLRSDFWGLNGGAGSGSGGQAFLTSYRQAKFCPASTGLVSSQHPFGCSGLRGIGGIHLQLF